MLSLNKKPAMAKPDKQIVEKLYAVCTTLARAPVFYSRFKVPDTVDGRFDFICLVLSLFLFKTQQIAAEIAQALFDLAFKDMERGLREAGVGDLGVPKHMKRMIQGFYGRSASYYEALEQQDAASLAAVLLRNLYNNDPAAPVGSMAEWVAIAWDYLSQIDAQEFFYHSQNLLQLLPPPAETDNA